MRILGNNLWRRAHRDQRGVTLIEVLVSLLVFSIIATIASGVFSQGMRLQARSAGAQRIQENATFVLDTIAKEVEYSTLVGATDTDCQSTFTSTLTVNHPVNGTVTYSLAGGTVYRTVGGETAAMSGSDVSFDRFSFCIMGSGLDDQQARVAIIARVRDVNGGADGLTFDVQTMVALRDVLYELQN